MGKKNNKGLIIIIIIVVILMSQGGEKKETARGSSTEQGCLDKWENEYQGCFTDCFYVHQDLVDACPALSSQNMNWWVYYRDDECDFLSSEQELVNCLEDNGIHVTYVEEPEGCSGPDADEEDFACRFGNVDQCLGGIWNDVGACSEWDGYTDSCDTFPLISRSNEDDAVEDCTEEITPPPPPISTCTDTDVTATYPNGENFYTKGTVTSSITGVTTDKCQNSTILLEYFCAGPDDSPLIENAVVTNRYQCTTGCSDGECIGDCTPTFWQPQKATICSGTEFKQTSDCGTERDAVGTKDCNGNGNGTPGPTTCTKNSDCYVNGVDVGKECGSKNRCVSSCLPILTKWDPKEGQCAISSMVIIAIIFMVAMVALKTLGKK